MALCHWIGAIIAIIGGGWLFKIVRARANAAALARRVNNGLLFHHLPAVDGSLRNASCGALLGAVLGNFRVRTRRSWRTPTASSKSYGVAVQVMLAAARALRADGQVNLRLYRLEMGYLSRYARGGSRRLRRRLAALRRDLRTPSNPHARGGEALLAAIPVGIAWHDQPARASALASALIDVTHGAGEARECGAILASAIAHALPRDARTPLTIAARRAWVARVFDSAGGNDNATALGLLTVADLASLDAKQASLHLNAKSPCISALEAGLYIALRHWNDPTAALEALNSGPKHSAVAGAIAMALIGCHMGHSGIADDLPTTLEDAEQVEAWGEKLALIRIAPKSQET